jgi:ATP-dependent Clp protease adaptor protein ClpS
MSTPVLEEKKAAGVDHSKPYNVLLWNDEVNTFQHVITCLVQIIGHSPAKAGELATLIHTEGKAVVKTTHLEYAETYRDSLEASGLTATIEPAE